MGKYEEQKKKRTIKGHLCKKKNKNYLKILKAPKGCPCTMAELGLKVKGANLKAPILVTRKVLRGQNREKKHKEKKLKEDKSRFKLNKLILFVYSNSFHLFFTIV